MQETQANEPLDAFELALKQKAKILNDCKAKKGKKAALTAKYFLTARQEKNT